MSVEATIDFGQLLREHRLAARLTQEALAERVGIGVRSLQALERGESKPLQDTRRRLEDALDLTAEKRIPFTNAAGPTPRRRTPAMPELTEPPAFTPVGGAGVRGAAAGRARSG